jgi:endonuclease III
MLDVFEQLYPEPSSELLFSSEYELVVAVLLSAQCTDKMVNQVTPLLFKTLGDFSALAEADIVVLEELLRSINYYKTKAKHLQELGKKVVTKYNGKLPLTHDELIDLPGVGRKTANVVLSELGVAHTFPVDTHVYRVSRRLGFTAGKSPIKVEEDLMKLFQPEMWRPLHHWLILHGRRVCKAQTPQCEKCKLSKWCFFKE